MNRFVQLGVLVAACTLLVVASVGAAQIVHFDCNAGSGATLSDVTGNGHNGLLYNGVTWVNDPWGGKAINFNGVENQYAMVSGAALTGIDAIEPTGSIEFWFYTPVDAPFGHYMDFYQGPGAGWSTHHLSLFCRNAWSAIPPAARNLATLSDGISVVYLWGLYDTDDAGNFIRRGAWTHVVLVWGPYSGGNLYYEYVNGVQVAGTSGALPLPEISGINWWIGRAYGNGNEYYTGIMDEISLYTNRLSQADALAHYNDGISRMVGYINGHVDLQGVTAGFDPSTVGVQVQLRTPGTTTPVKTVKTLLDAAGNFTVSANPGTYDVAVKAANWLQEVAGNVTVGLGTTVPVSVSLKNGDLNGDNQVSPADPGALLPNVDSQGAP
jgi:hypothetical protein